MQTIYAYSYNPAIATGTNTTNTVWRMAYQQPIMLYKGTANSIKLVIFNNNQKVVNLTNWDVQVQIVDRETEQRFVTRTATNNAPTSGVVLVEFTEADLRNLQHRFYHIIARLMPIADGSTVSEGEILYLDDNYGAFTPVTIEDAWNYSPSTINVIDGINSVGNLLPATHNTYYLGNSMLWWNSLYTVNANLGNLSVNNSTIQSSTNSITFDVNAAYLTGDLLPGGAMADPTPQHSLGSVTRPWKDLYVSNSTIYVGGVPITVDATGNLLVGGTLVTADTGNIDISGNTISSTNANGNLVLDPNGTGSLIVNASQTLNGNLITNGNVITNGNLTTIGSVTANGNVTTNGNVITNGNVTTNGNLTVNGVSNLGAIGNIRITGGSSGQVISTDGAGNLSWASRGLTVGTRTGSTNNVDAVTGVTAIRFAKQPFSVTNLGGGEILVESESSFNPIRINGTGGVTAVGEQPLNLIAGSGIQITANNTSSPKSITITNTGGGGGGGGDTLTTLEFTQTAYNEDFWIGDWVYFAKANNAVAADVIDTGLTITRGANGGIYNSAIEVAGQWWNQPDSSLLSPVGTEWNNSGWQDLSDVTERNYSAWLATAGYYAGHLPGAELVMHDIANDKYYAVQFLSWQVGGQGGGFSYRRRRINTSIYFSKPRSATDLGLVDAIAPGLVLARGISNGEQGLFNTAAGETAWDQNLSPVGTLWNNEGWDDLSNYTSRQYLNFRSVTKNLNNDYAVVVGMELIMHDTINNEYYAVMFTGWDASYNAASPWYPGYRYVRRKLNAANTKQGLTFVDGSIQQKAVTEKRLGIIPAWKFRPQVSGEYITLNQTHAGKHIVVSQPDTIVWAVDYAMSPIESGSVFTIINRTGTSNTIDIQLTDENERESFIYGAGTGDFGKTWRCTDLGGGAIVTLIKLDTTLNNSSGEARSTWMISGHNLSRIA